MPMRDARSGEEMLTIREAAEELGLSPSTLRAQVARGQIKVTKLTDRLNLISRSAVEAYRREHLGQPTGPKPKRQRAQQEDGHKPE